MSFQVIINSAAFESTVIRQVEPMMEDALGEIKATMIQEFNAPKSGREYRSARGTHRASAPGEPPAGRTGGLEASIGEPQVGREGRFLVGRLEIAARYAGYLERGTPRIKPRPFIRPAIEELLRRRS